MTPGSQSVGLHQPVQVELGIWNSDAATLAWIGNLALEGDTLLEVTYPDGRREKLGPPKWARRPDVMSPVSMVTLAPGEVHRQSILLHDWLPFDREGKYAITLSVRGAESPVTFYVDIGPRNEAALKAQCEKLIATAFQPHHPERTFAARALANVQDPIAIPYLERLAGTFGLDDRYARAALFEMGTPAAIRALGAAVARGLPTAAREVRELLRKLQESSPNPDVRQAAADVLAIRRLDDSAEGKP